MRWVQCTSNRTCKKDEFKFCAQNINSLIESRAGKSARDPRNGLEFSNYLSILDIAYKMFTKLTYTHTWHMHTKQTENENCLQSRKEYLPAHLSICLYFHWNKLFISFYIHLFLLSPLCEWRSFFSANWRKRQESIIRELPRHLKSFGLEGLLGFSFSSVEEPIPQIMNWIIRIDSLHHDTSQNLDSSSLSRYIKCAFEFGYVILTRSPKKVEFGNQSFTN